MAILTDLPNELIEAIVRQMPEVSDRARFSRTSQRLYDIARPEVFRSLVVRTKKPNTVSSALLASCRLGKLVKELSIIIGRTKTQGHYGDEQESFPFPEDYEKDRAIWQRSASQLLVLFRGLVYYGDLPRLQTLKIEFPDYHSAPLEELGHRPSQDDTGKVWGMIMDRPNTILGAIVVPGYTNITDLRLSNLPPLLDGPEVPNVLSWPAWASFLRQIEHFELSLYSALGEDDYMPTSTASPLFREFVASLESRIFDNLTRVKYIKLQGNEHGMIGHNHAVGQGQVDPVPLPLGHKNMPALSTLELDTIIVDQSFIDFLAHRPQDSQPLNLKLTNATCLYITDLDNPQAPSESLKWREVFDKMSQLMDRRAVIQSLDIQFWEIKRSKDMLCKWYCEQLLELELFAASNPERIMFPYIDLSGWGDVNDENSPVIMKRAFLAMEDQRQYDKLLARIKKCNKAVDLTWGRPRLC